MTANKEEKLKEEIQASDEDALDSVLCAMLAAWAYTKRDEG